MTQIDSLKRFKSRFGFAHHRHGYLESVDDLVHDSGDLGVGRQVAVEREEGSLLAAGLV